MEDPDPVVAAALAAIKQQQNNLSLLHPEQEQLKCPRCDSNNTKFCYYNNYNLTQPRHFCKSCRRYWTHGGTLRNVPLGGSSRKRPSTSAAAKKPSSTTLPLPSATITVLDLQACGGGGVMVEGLPCKLRKRGESGWCWRGGSSNNNGWTDLATGSTLPY